MSLKGKRLEKLCEAFLDAYRSQKALNSLTLFSLECSLDTITSPGNLSEVVIELLQWAESHGRLSDLLDKAIEMNSKNPFLADAVRDFRAGSTSISEEQLKLVRTQYLDFILRECGSLEPRGIPQTVRHVTLPLDKVYVSLTVEREAEREREEVARELLEWAEEKSDMPRKPPAGLPSRREIIRQKVMLPQTIADHPRLVLLGKPGAGKTTITRFLAAQFARALKECHERVRDGDGHDYGEPRLPIRIRIADYADAFRKDHNLALRDFLVQVCHHKHQAYEAISTLFENALQNGQAFVIFDGLDEVSDAPTRSEIARRIETFLSHLEPGNPVLVTSRIAGYAEARLDDRFSKLTIRDMDREQIGQFLRRWCVAVERFHDDKAEESAVVERGEAESQALLRTIETSEGVQRLAVNPLLLTILALIHRQNTRLPKRRIQLYELATETLLRDWRVAQAGAEGRVISPSEEETLLWPLALWMHEEAETGRVPKAEARQKLRELYADSYGLRRNDPRVIDAVDDFLRRVTEHSGLFVPYPSDEYGFLHLTFEEYMAGCALVSEYETAVAKLRSLRHRTRWEEPLRLAIASQTTKNAANLIRAAIWSPDGAQCHCDYEPSEYEAILHRDLLLAARCLGDSESIAPVLAQEVATALVALLLARRGDPPFPSLWKGITEVLTFLRSSETGTEAAQLLLAASQDVDSDVREAAARALGQVGADNADVVTTLLTLATRDVASDVRRAATGALGQMGAGNAEIIATLLTLAPKDTEWVVREAAARALGQVGAGNSEVVTTLLTLATKDVDSDVRRAAARALGQVGAGSSEVIATLYAASQDADWKVRRAATGALGQMGAGSSEIIATLLTLAKDTDWNVRYMAARALGQVGAGSSEVVTTLLTLATKDADSDVRRAAVEALGQVGAGNSEVVTTLLTLATKDTEWVVREAAAEGLGQVGAGSSEVVTTLLTLAKDTDWNGQYMAVGALGQVGAGSSEVVTTLLTLAQNAHWNVRRAAAGALGQMGAGSSEVVTTLLTLAKYPNWNVREAAAESLWRIVARRA